MSAPFIQSLLWEGRLLVEPAPFWEPNAAAVTLLEEAFAERALDLAGPPLEIALDVMVAAVKVVYRFGWYALHANVVLPEDDQSLKMPLVPQTPSQHFSADVVLRFLAALHARVKKQAPQDGLGKQLQTVLRDWPLSGVLADIVEPPAIPVDFGGHPGLCYLYAERLAQKERPGWLPSGSTLEYVELVWDALGKDVSQLGLSVRAEPLDDSRA